MSKIHNTFTVGDINKADVSEELFTWLSDNFKTWKDEILNEDLIDIHKAIENADYPDIPILSDNLLKELEAISEEAKNENVSYIRFIEC